MCRSSSCRDVPLVATLAFRKYEFYCLDCGSHLGFMEPDAADETPELVAEMDARKAEWDENAGPKLLTPNAWRESCEQCRLGDYAATHVSHATDEEKAADVAAREWIRGRVKVKVPS